MAINSEQIAVLVTQALSVIGLLASMILSNCCEDLCLKAAYICMLIQIIGQFVGGFSWDTLDYCIHVTHVRVVTFLCSLTLLQINYYSSFRGFHETITGKFLKVSYGICGIAKVFLYAIMVYFESISTHGNDYQVWGLCHREILFTTINTIIVSLSLAETMVLLFSSFYLTYCCNTNQTKDDRFWTSFWLLFTANVTWMIPAVAILVMDLNSSTGQHEMSRLWYLPIAMNGMLFCFIQYATPKLRNRTAHHVKVDNNIRMENSNDIENQFPRKNVPKLIDIYEKLILEANRPSNSNV